MPLTLLARPLDETPPSDRLAAVWWLWLPLAALLFLSLTSLLASDWYETWINQEVGGIELAQALLAFLGFLVALGSLPLAVRRAPRWVAGWLLLAALCCLYVAGEETSWGQHLFGWSTPEEWAALNDQNETNLHNTSAWFDQKPRWILGFAIGVGGIGVPLLALRRPAIRRGRLAVVLPPFITLPAAVIAVFVGIVWTLDGWRGTGSLFIRPSEVQEFFFYVFVLLYLVVLRRRLLALPPPGVLT
jgi:hypothetical protein